MHLYVKRPYTWTVSDHSPVVTNYKKQQILLAHGTMERDVSSFYFLMHFLIAKLNLLDSKLMSMNLGPTHPGMFSLVTLLGPTRMSYIACSTALLVIDSLRRDQPLINDQIMNQTTMAIEHRIAGSWTELTA